MAQSEGVDQAEIIAGVLMRAYPDRYREVARLQARDALPSGRAMWTAVHLYLQGLEPSAARERRVVVPIRR